MKVAIVGVTGYTGMELVRLLRNHPILEIGTLHSHRNYGEDFANFYPQFQNMFHQEIEAYDPQKIMEKNQLVFFATPAGVSKELVAPFVAADFPVMDLSGDLRLKDGASYQKWYGKPPADEKLLSQAEYYLPELQAIPQGKLISNPGCYATVAQLVLAPLLAEHLIEEESIILDGKSGLSGAGKHVTDASHFVNVNENMTMYKLNQHQHIPEIIQQLQLIDANFQTLHFTTSLIPVNRGIFLSSYSQLKVGVTEKQVTNAYQQYYQNQPFIRMQPTGTLPDLHQVVGSNFCDIGFGVNHSNQILTVVGVIDNLIKGASGQAIQSVNKWLGIEETTGLLTPALFI